MQKIQTGDTVVVIAGKWKGTTSTITRVIKRDRNEGNLVVVKGVNLVKKAVKGEGFKEFEKPIHVSNVMLRDDSVSAISRVGIQKNSKGRNERFYKKSNKAIA